MRSSSRFWVGPMARRRLIANRVREALESAALFVDGQRIGATVSVGIAVTDGLSGTIADMMQEADAALYRAKDEGRNRVVLAPPQRAVRGLRQRHSDRLRRTGALVGLDRVSRFMDTV